MPRKRWKQQARCTFYHHLTTWARIPLSCQEAHGHGKCSHIKHTCAAYTEECFNSHSGLCVSGIEEQSSQVLELRVQIHLPLPCCQPSPKQVKQAFSKYSCTAHLKGNAAQETCTFPAAVETVKRAVTGASSSHPLGRLLLRCGKGQSQSCSGYWLCQLYQTN